MENEEYVCDCCSEVKNKKDDGYLVSSFYDVKVDYATCEHCRDEMVYHLYG